MDDLGEKLDGYITKIKEAEDKEDWDLTLSRCKEYYEIIDTLMTNEVNPLSKNHYFVLKNATALLRRIITRAKTEDERFKKQEARLNNLEGRIKRIEDAKGFDNAEKLT